MNLGVSLTIIGIVISIGIFLLQKKRKYPGHVECVVLDVRKVVNRTNRIPGDLSLQSQGITIEQNLLAVEFAIYNQREFDIVLKEGERILIELPSDYAWVSLAVKENKDSIVPCIEKRDNRSSCALSFSMLKKSDYIILEGLIETPSLIGKKTFSNILKVDYRLQEVGNCKPVVLPKFDKGLVASLSFYLVVFSILMAISFITPLRRHPLHSVRYMNLSDSTYHTIMVDNQNQYRDVKSGYFRSNSNSPVISRDQFEVGFVPTTSYELEREESALLWTISVFVFLTFVGLLALIINGLRQNKILKLLNYNKEKSR